MNFFSILKSKKFNKLKFLRKLRTICTCKYFKCCQRQTIPTLTEHNNSQTHNNVHDVTEVVETPKPLPIVCNKQIYF